MRRGRLDLQISDFCDVEGMSVEVLEVRAADVVTGLTQNRPVGNLKIDKMRTITGDVLCD